MPGAVDRGNPLKLLWDAIKRVVRKLPGAIFSLHNIAQYVLSLLTVAAVVVLGYLVYLLVVYMRPAAPTLWHSSDFQRFMDEDLLPDFVGSLNVFHGNLDYILDVMAGTVVAPTTATSAYSPLRLVTKASVLYEAKEAMNKLMSNPDQALLRKMIGQYYALHLVMSRRNEFLYSLFVSGIMTHVEHFQDQSGKGLRLDWDRVQAFEESIMKPLGALRDVVQAISATADANPDAVPASALPWLTAVHKLRMYLNEYHDQLVDSAMSRIKDPYCVGVWVLRYIPLVGHILRDRIPGVWREMPVNYTRMKGLWHRGWKQLGVLIVNVPCYIVFSDKDRRSTCNNKVIKVIDYDSLDATTCGGERTTETYAGVDVDGDGDSRGGDGGESPPLESRRPWTFDAAMYLSREVRPADRAKLVRAAEQLAGDAHVVDGRTLASAAEKEGIVSAAAAARSRFSPTLAWSPAALGMADALRAPASLAPAFLDGVLRNAEHLTIDRGLPEVSQNTVLQAYDAALHAQYTNPVALTAAAPLEGDPNEG